jgi:NitT/TauT family transport system substrate-binding protein
MRRREVVAATLALACAPRVARAQNALEKVVVAAPISEDLTSLYYAIKNGMFARAGLDVSLLSAGSGTAATTAVIAGTYQMSRTSPMAVLSAHMRDIPVSIIAPSIVITSEHPWVMMQIAPDAPYRTAADLNGRTIGVPALGDIISLSIKAWVDKNGGDSRTLRFVEVPNVALEAAIVSHRVDAGVLQTPQLDASLATGTTKSLGYPYGAIAPLFFGGVFVVRTDWADQHADAVRRYVRVLFEAAAYVNAHPTETAPLVAELTKIEIADVRKLRRSLNGTSVDPALIQPVIDVAAKYELIARAFPAREILWGASR